MRDIVLAALLALSLACSPGCQGGAASPQPLRPIGNAWHCGGHAWR
jgi:hypothetical protein